jgi:Bax protein
MHMRLFEHNVVRYLHGTLLMLAACLFSTSAAAWGRYPAVPSGYAGPPPGAMAGYYGRPAAAAYPGYSPARWMTHAPPGYSHAPALQRSRPRASRPASGSQYHQPVPVLQDTDGLSTGSVPVAHIPAVHVDPEQSSRSRVEAGQVLPARLAAPELSASDKKQLFIETLLPLIEIENLRVQKQRERALKLLQEAGRGRQPGHDAVQWLQQLAKSYRVEGDPLEDAAAAAALQARVDVIPTGLALAQAANESGWGSSRFAQEANNLFGIWTYDPEKGIKPKRRASGKTHLVRVFDSLRESVRIYISTLNSHPAYESLRSRRAQLRKEQQPLQAIVLADGLVKYSGLGQEYVTLIKNQIRHNELERIDYTRLAAAS